MSADLVTALVLVGCGALVYATQDRIFKTMEWNSSPLDWCEKNHEYTPWIVEFWNTMSSFLLAFVGLAGWIVYRNNKNINKYEPQFYLIWAMMIVVGLGSVWFHGTLSVAGQVSDEVPIVVLAAVAVMMSRPKTQWGGRSREIALSGHTLVRGTTMFVIFCLLFPVASHIFTLVCFPLCSYYFFGDYARSKNPQFRRLFRTGVLLFACAFGSWIVDRVACEQVSQFGETYLWGYPQLHAVWHLFIGLSFWFMIALGITMRAEQEKVTFSLDHSGGGFTVVHMLV